MEDRNSSKIIAGVHEVFSVWSRARSVVTIMQMLTTNSLRESFLQSCVETLGLELPYGTLLDLRRQSLENFILKELVKNHTLVFSEDLN